MFWSIVTGVLLLPVSSSPLLTAFFEIYVFAVSLFISSVVSESYFPSPKWQSELEQNAQKMKKVALYTFKA